MSRWLLTVIEAYNIIDKTIELEGGYVNHPSDPGGATMYGLSSKWNPSLRSKIINQTLTIEEARLHYYKNYYINNYRINDLPAPLRFIIFDQRVHGSDSLSVIQAWYNNRLRDKRSRLSVDGVYGPKTFRALHSIDWTVVESNGATTLLNLLTYLIYTVKDSGIAAAKLIAGRQESLGLPHYDYTNGMINRFKKRYSHAREMEVRNV